jgi:hypothetical protein
MTLQVGRTLCVTSPHQVTIGAHVIPFDQVTGFAVEVSDPSLNVGPTRVRRAGTRKVATLMVGYHKTPTKIALAIVQLQIDDRDIPGGRELVQFLMGRLPDRWRGQHTNAAFQVMKMLGYDTRREKMIIAVCVVVGTLLVGGLLAVLIAARHGETTSHERRPPGLPSGVGARTASQATR